MPRRARIILRNTPHHIVQRGHNRAAVFVEESDYRHYLDTLQEWSAELGIKLYSYCLMTNHVHLIVDPGDDPANMGWLMKRLAGRQTRHVNALERRSGSLWEGRFKSSPIETDTYLLACCRYVELNPVRAGMVGRAEDYVWSSYWQKAGLAKETSIELDPAYLGLGPDNETRILRYTHYVHQGVPEAQRELIEEALQRGQLTGTSRFVEEVEARLGLRVEHRGPGRPRKVREASTHYG